MTGDMSYESSSHRTHHHPLILFAGSIVPIRQTHTRLGMEDDDSSALLTSASTKSLEDDITWLSSVLSPSGSSASSSGPPAFSVSAASLSTRAHSSSIPLPFVYLSTLEPQAVDGRSRAATEHEVRPSTRKVACNNCHIAKVSCIGERPCERCLRLGKSGCVDRHSKRQRLSPSDEDMVGRGQSEWESDAKLTRPRSTEAVEQDTVPVHWRTDAITPALSRALIQGHLRWIHGQDKAFLGRVLDQMGARERLVYYAKLRDMMSANDVDTFVLSLGQLRLSGNLNPHRLATSPKVQQDLASTMRKWADANRCTFDWMRSPTVGVADRTDRSDYASLVVRSLTVGQDKQSQSRLIIRNTLALAALEQQSAAGNSICQEEDASKASLDRGEEIDIKRLGQYSRVFNTTSGRPSASDSAIVTELLQHGDISSMGGEPIRIPMLVEVNAAFERLCGISQAELRTRLTRDGVPILYSILHPSNWAEVMERCQSLVWCGESDFRMYSTCMNKWTGGIPCLLHVEYDQGNGADQWRATFIPLPK